MMKLPVLRQPEKQNPVPVQRHRVFFAVRDGRNENQTQSHPHSLNCSSPQGEEA